MTKWGVTGRHHDALQDAHNEYRRSATHPDHSRADPHDEHHADWNDKKEEEEEEH